MRKSTNKTTLMKLAQAARAVGVTAETIEAHPHDFFGVRRLGGQRYCVRAEFESWVAQTTAQHHAEAG